MPVLIFFFLTCPHLFSPCFSPPGRWSRTVRSRRWRHRTCCCRIPPASSTTWWRSWDSLRSPACGTLPRTSMKTNPTWHPPSTPRTLRTIGPQGETWGVQGTCRLCPHSTLLGWWVYWVSCPRTSSPPTDCDRSCGCPGDSFWMQLEKCAVKLLASNSFSSTNHRFVRWTDCSLHDVPRQEAWLEDLPPTPPSNWGTTLH